MAPDGPPLPSPGGERPDPRIALRRALADLAAALGYVLAGGVGAAALAMAGAPLIAEHAQPNVDPSGAGSPISA